MTPSGNRAFRYWSHGWLAALLLAGCTEAGKPRPAAAPAARAAATVAATLPTPNTAGPQLLTARNASQPTLCAEEDNIAVPLFAAPGVRTLEITATHPQGDLRDDNCEANFTNCATNDARDFPFTPETRKLFDDGRTVLTGVRVERWFLPDTMAASLAGGRTSPVHFVRLIRCIDSTRLFPEVMVIYMDGNLRLKPQAPADKPNHDTCFGSSVLIGPADPSAKRPVAQIASLVYDPVADRFDLTYRDGSTATIAVHTLNRSQLTIRVGLGYPLSSRQPAAIFRSMFVADGNADVDRIQSNAGTAGILSFTEVTGPYFTFMRAVRSVHNTSAPDLRIGVCSEP